MPPPPRGLLDIEPEDEGFGLLSDFADWFSRGGVSGMLGLIPWDQLPREDIAMGFAGGGLGTVKGVGKKALDFGLLGAGRQRGSFSLDYFGTPVRVLQNPSVKEIEGFLGRTKFKAARRLVDQATGDTFIWDAADPALHGLLAKELGIDAGKMVADIIGID